MITFNLKEDQGIWLHYFEKLLDYCYEPHQDVATRKIKEIEITEECDLILEIIQKRRKNDSK